MSESKMVAQWHHVAVSVCDMDAMLHFFRDLLGFEVEWDHPHRSGPEMEKVVGLQSVDAHVIMLQGYGTRVELFHYYEPAGENCGPLRQCDYGITHFCLSVKGLHELYDRLSQAGVKFNCPPQNLRPGVWATYMKGPEDITIELVQYDDPQ